MVNGDGQYVPQRQMLDAGAACLIVVVIFELWLRSPPFSLGGLFSLFLAVSFTPPGPFHGFAGSISIPPTSSARTPPPPRGPALADTIPPTTGRPRSRPRTARTQRGTTRPPQRPPCRSRNSTPRSTSMPSSAGHPGWRSRSMAFCRYRFAHTHTQPVTPRAERAGGRVGKKRDDLTIHCGGGGGGGRPQVARVEPAPNHAVKEHHPQQRIICDRNKIPPTFKPTWVAVGHRGDLCWVTEHQITSQTKENQN